jgi:hypothetical protein
MWPVAIRHSCHGIPAVTPVAVLRDGGRADLAASFDYKPVA